MRENIYFWAGFIILIAVMLALDLGVFHRKLHRVGVREALRWSGVWISIALAFGVVVYFDYLRESPAVARIKILEYLTAYLIEYSLSVDNIFVFILIFSYFAVDATYQHKVLFWGIIGAIVMRAIFIFAGVTLIHKVHWVVYIFGAFLVYSGIKMLSQIIRKIVPEVEPERNPVIKFSRKFIRISESERKDRFFTKIDGKLYATPLFLVLLVIESSDLIFAVDSIPAVLAISSDPFIVLTSNILAILGLRSLYFAVSGIMRYFRYLKTGLSVVLIFVGLKMIFAEAIKKLEVPVYVSLIIIVLILASSVLLSVIIPERDKK
ncbi:MAG TPA: TerC family protein [Bacteroidales bacterium]|nr:TerC family protein [Bacteroidales bacterium]